MKPTENVFSLEPGLSTRAVLASVAAQHATRKRALSPRREVWYDTFDGRLASAGGKLYSFSTRGATRVTWVGPEAVRPQEVAVDTPPGMARDLPEGHLREQLGPLIEMRRLLPLVEVENRVQALDVLNEDRKTVARLLIEESRAKQPGQRRWKNLPPVVRAVPLRGYESEFEALRKSLEQVEGLQVAAVDQPGLALNELGLELPSDHSKPAIELDPKMRADAGVVRIHRALLDVILRNEGGVRADLDSEFLHDYRVAVRRTRSVLSQVKDVLPERSVDKFKREFKWLGTVTGPTRDLDVFLLRLDDYEAELGDVDLGVLRKFLVQRQRAEHKKLVRALDSKRYRRLIDDWNSFLESPPTSGDEPRKAARTVRDVLSTRIRKMYARMTARAGQLEGAPVPALHELRLEGKKLRYLLDVSRSLYPADACQRAIRELKRLQEVLGDFNDFDVQRGQLLEISEQLVSKRQADATTLLALGRVSERLRQRGDDARARFAKRFERFASEDNQRRYRELFGRTRRSK